jgi:hypothetical protein
VRRCGVGRARRRAAACGPGHKARGRQAKLQALGRRRRRPRAPPLRTRRRATHAITPRQSKHTCEKSMPLCFSSSMLSLAYMSSLSLKPLKLNCHTVCSPLHTGRLPSAQRVCVHVGVGVTRCAVALSRRAASWQLPRAAATLLWRLPGEHGHGSVAVLHALIHARNTPPPLHVSTARLTHATARTCVRERQAQLYELQHVHVQLECLRTHNSQ